MTIKEIMSEAPATGCLKKGLVDSQVLITTAAGSQMPPAQILIVHKSFSEWGCLLGISNPYKENDSSCQELISS